MLVRIHAVKTHHSSYGSYTGVIADAKFKRSEVSIQAHGQLNLHNMMKSFVLSV
jgi:hypothetical protein